MAYGQPQPKPDDFWHVPETDIMKEVPGKAYKLPDYIKKSLDEIENELKNSKDLTRDKVKGYFEFLEDLTNRVREMIQNEKTEGISNMELEKDFRRITQLFNQVSGLLDRY